jgi:hypothetical protein
MTGCGNCGEQYRPGDRYCAACGAHLIAPLHRALEPSGPSTVQTRRVSLLTPVLLVGTAALLLAAVWLWPSDAEEPYTFAPVTGGVAQLVSVGADVSPHQTLGGPTGRTAVGLTDTGLVAIDLDTAQRRTLGLSAATSADSGVTSGYRMVLAGERVVLATLGDAIWEIDLTSGFAQSLAPGRRLAPSTAHDHVWALQPSTVDGAESWVEIDAEGRELRAMSLPSGAVHWDHGLGSPERVWLPTTGILVLEADGAWRRVSGGAPIAGSTSVAIEQRCDAGGHCTYRWIDLDTGDVIDRPLPPTLNKPGAHTYRLSPSGAQVLEVGPTTSEILPVHLYGTSYSRHTGCGAGWRTAAWSADESLLACADGETISVTDLRQGTMAAFDMEAPTYGVVLVATDVVGID